MEAGSFNKDISLWDVSLVEDFSEMYHLAGSFNQALNWTTSSATTMNAMFKEAGSFNDDITSWDVSLVEDFSDM